MLTENLIRVDTICFCNLKIKTYVSKPALRQLFNLEPTRGNCFGRQCVGVIFIILNVHVFDYFAGGGHGTIAPSLR